ncbi:hypothetical protein QRX60_17110 [Amycolatopsis mongoliensis]|uniref:Uncharacterized protein n=1 Tax=Amycolatopsis mongoliensis TaxID=715475 RepID=A0A9Y2JYU4_9PSEU|nr:hypothetical protein [Amycolatopsis sp. 4-36]WIY05479.1 hypothetical protein QRX60_17110 [Amycolatopsis sp. 4-36]
MLVGLAPAHAAAAPSCDRAALVDTRLAQLGRFGVEWRVGPTRPDAWGVARPDEGVTVSEVVPCNPALILSIVNHEWMHTQQQRAYPDSRLRSRAYGRNVETVADCGSLLLGSRYTPYLDARARETCRAVVGCTAFEDGAARRLLAAAGQ